MTRSLCLAAALVGFAATAAAEPRQFSQPLDVAAERAKIVREFIAAQQAHRPYAPALAARDDGFRQLLAAADAAGSTEYRQLGEIAAALGDKQTALRNANAALEKSPYDLGSRLLLFSILVDLNRRADAASEYAKIAATDVSLADQTTYVQTFPQAAKAYIEALIKDKQLDEATKALATWNDQLDRLEAVWSKSPGYKSGFGGPIFGPRQVTTSLDHSLLQLRVQMAASPQPTPQAAPAAPVAPAPLYVGSEIAEILAKYDPAKSPAGVDAAKILAQRDEALRALAARPEISTNRDFVGLMKLMTLLKRPDDALAVATRWLNEELAPQNTNMESSLDAARASQDQLTPLVLLLGAAGKFNEAFQVLTTLDAKLAEFLESNERHAAPHTLPIYKVYEANETLRAAFAALRNAEGAACVKTKSPLPIVFSSPLNISRETFRTSVRYAALSQDDPARADAEQLAQLRQLAATAEQQPAPLYADIVSLEIQARDKDATFRVARDAVAKYPQQLAPHVALLYALWIYDLKDELGPEWSKLSSVDMSTLTEEDGRQFLAYAEGAGTSLVQDLTYKKKTAEATGVLDTWESILKAIESKFPKLRGTVREARDPRRGSDDRRVERGTVASVRDMVESLRNELKPGSGVRR